MVILGAKANVLSKHHVQNRGWNQNVENRFDTKNFT